MSPIAAAVAAAVTVMQMNAMSAALGAEPILRINCGDNKFDVPGWEQDDPYAKGGRDWTNGNSIDTSGAANAAPAPVYKSVRHSGPHSYVFGPDKVPDGTYILRIHFCDAYQDRKLRYTAEGKVILDEFDISSAAGGSNKAVVKEFTVEVSDGDGLHLKCEAVPGGRSMDVFECGIEILSGKPRKIRGKGTYFIERRDNILVLGDAVLAQGGVLDIALHEDLSGEYDELLSSGKIKVVNLAEAGHTSADGIQLLDQTLQRSRPNVAIVCYGLNDSIADGNRYADNMRRIVKALKDKGVAVTLLTPPGLNSTDFAELGARSAALAELVGSLRQIAADEGVLLADCYGPMKEHVEAGKGDLSWGDGVHPNAKGRRMMADALKEAWGFGKPLAE